MEKLDFPHLQSFGTKAGRRNQLEWLMDVQLLDTGKADQLTTQASLDNGHRNAAYRAC